MIDRPAWLPHWISRVTWNAIVALVISGAIIAFAQWLESAR